MKLSDLETLFVDSSDVVDVCVSSVAGPFSNLSLRAFTECVVELSVQHGTRSKHEETTSEQQIQYVGEEATQASESLTFLRVSMAFPQHFVCGACNSEWTIAVHK